MPEIVDEQTREQLIELLSHLVNPVTLLLFTEADDCPACQQQREVLEAVTALSDKLVTKKPGASDDCRSVHRDHDPLRRQTSC